MKRILCILTTIFILSALLTGICLASDNTDTSTYDYYIKSYDVNVVANADRSYDITETILVHFNVPKHGIYRSIPTYSSVEEYSIKNVQVDGAPFEYSEDGEYGTIKIGDADVEITGEKQYVIKYTLDHYADTSDQYDYLYLDIIGTEWECPILSFSSNITLPEGSALNSYTITGGNYGSKGGSDLADVTVNGNVISVTGKQALESYIGVTIEAELNEGAFSKAEKWMPMLTINSLDTKVDINQYGEFNVVEHYKATVNREDAYFYRSLDDAYNPDTMGREITDATVTTPDGTSFVASDFNAPGLDLSNYAGQQVEFSIRYTIEYAIKTSGELGMLTFSMIDSNHDVWIDHISVRVSAPVEASGFYLNYVDETNPQFYITQNGTSYLLENKNTLTNYEDIDGLLKFPDGSFARRTRVSDILLPIFTGVCALAILAVALTNSNDPLSPPVEFYPPENLNPSEVGYIIDGQVDGRDVTTLIYYWAAHGHLSIEMTSKSGFKLHKLNPLESTHAPYEFKMYTDLWALGDEDSVSSGQLESAFYTTIGETQRAVKSTFSGDRAIENKTFGTFTFLGGCLTPILGSILIILSATLSIFTQSIPLSATVLLIGCFVLFISASNAYKLRRKQKAGKRILRVVFWLAIYALCISAFMSGFAGSILATASALITVVSLLLSATAAPFMQKKTGFGRYILERCLGFKNFLETAEKSRLELLLADDPEYYYKILPYAHVLGVSKIWEKKFDGLLTQPPSWYYGDGVSTNIGSFGMLMAMNSLSRSMTSIPASSSSGSGSGSGFSGGGSFGGGGFSGGGSGGGGGGSW